jgi:hypothetical protein
MALLSRRLFLGAGVVGGSALGLAHAFAQTPPPAPAPGGKWMCPACGCDDDGKTFDKPGTCPAPGCGMTLVPKPAAPPKGL